MISVEKITKPEQLCIGQLYMFKERWGTNIKRGYCVKIFQDKAVFRNNNSYERDSEIPFVDCHYPQKKYNYIAEYNPRVYHRYKKLLEQQEEERFKLLNGDFVLIAEIGKEKWYKRFLRKVKK